MSKLNTAVFIIILLAVSALFVWRGTGMTQQADKPEAEAKQDDSPKAYQDKAKKAIDNAVNYLKTQQLPNGSWMDNVGITALIVEGMANCPRQYRYHSNPMMSKAVDFIVGQQKPDGSIVKGDRQVNYNTSIAVMALAAIDNPKFKPNLEKAKAFLLGSQLDEDHDFEKSKHAGYGGFGYGSSQEPDQVNTAFAAEALKALDLPKDDPAWDKIAVFVTRTIQNPEVNDLARFEGLRAKVGDSGGAVYKPDHSNAGRLGDDDEDAWRAYGTVTYAAMKTLLYAGVDEKDPRIKSVWDWLKLNYTVTENPGMGKAGLYYYYNTMPRALNAKGVEVVTDNAGIEHHWRKELIGRIVKLQREDGSWINENPRWWENQPVLSTAYCIRALNAARQFPEEKKK